MGEPAMTTVILDEALAERLKADRAQRGGDRYDEVWEGVYMMAAMPNNEHQCFRQPIFRDSSTKSSTTLAWAKSFPDVTLAIERIGRRIFACPTLPFS